MAVKAAVLLPLADWDIREAIQYYRKEGGSALAKRWAKSVETAIRHIAANPGTGSLRYQSLLSIPDLRFWPVERFPYLIFYIERQTCVEIWRVLHGRRDLPAWLTVGP